MPELATCQCARFPETPRAHPFVPCPQIATAEDLLCDTCREGCNAATGCNTDHPRHIRVTDWRWTLA